MNKADVLEAIATVPYWRHIIDLPFGVKTPGRVGKELLDCLGLPKDLSGKAVLDIGSFDGLCAFEAEARGARRVLATDTWHGLGTDDPEWWSRIHTGGAGFRVAKQLLGSRVEAMEISAYDLEPARIGVFEYVLMIGVVYHLRNPLVAIEKALSVTAEVLLIESTAIALTGTSLPLLAFQKRRNEIDCPSIWWEFTPEALIDMCYVAGGRQVTLQHAEWFQPCIRRVVTSGPLHFFSGPRSDAALLATSGGGNEFTVRSRRYTFRDGFYWLRVSMPTPDIGPASGWLRFDPDTPLPRISEHPTQSTKTTGRIVLRVEP